MLIFFEPNLSKKGISSLKQIQWTVPMTANFRINLDTKFQFKQTILIFWPNLPKNGISSLKYIEWTARLNSAYSN